MKLKSFVNIQNQLVPIEVEVQLMLGLPQIQFMGLPDQGVRETALKIKSAIKAQGFHFPKSHQVLVNLRPNHFKKTSRGVELAVALAILWLTDQLPKPLLDSNTFIYGELGLNGEVYEPEDLVKGFTPKNSVFVVTGTSDSKSAYLRRGMISNLSEFSQMRKIPQAEVEKIRPRFGLELMYSEKVARWISILALGELHGLLAGQSGAGKSTLAKAVKSFISPPKDLNLSWRPEVVPHHSATAMAMIGGGSPPKKGELSRAHGGVLILDELLEFDPQIQEALREPMETGLLRLSRSHHSLEFEADFLTIATTNLCPCGKWIPQKNMSCRYSRKKCLSYSERLTGPLMDRFQVIFFFDDKILKEPKTISGETILEKIEVSKKWMFESGKLISKKSQTENMKLGSEICEVEKRIKDVFLLSEIQNRNWSSERRKKSTLRVAEVVANLDCSEEILFEHWKVALEIADLNFQRLQNWN